MKPLYIYALLLLVFAACSRETIIEISDDGNPPAPPVGLALYYAMDGIIAFDWKANTEGDIEKYFIYRKIEQADYSLIDSTYDLFYVNYSLDYEKRHYYKITAKDKFGYESNFSDEISAVPDNILNPLPPRSVNINARNYGNQPLVEISWRPPADDDVDRYYIYRSTEFPFEADSLTLHDSTNYFIYDDTTDVIILREYFYKIIAADKGGLRSDPSSTVSDLILDKPKVIYPGANSEVSSLYSFSVQTCSAPAKYKILISGSEDFSNFESLTFTSAKTNKIISVENDTVYLYPYTIYYIKVVTYTNNNPRTNSSSEVTQFIIIPD